jgi:hypothetical protein
MTIKHSFLPPSGASAWSKCALWPTMNARYPESNTTSAEEGTAAHWVMSEMLAGREVAEDTLSPNGVTITGEMIEGAELVRDTVDARVAQDYQHQLHIEETLSIPAINSDCFGTPDIWAYDPLSQHLEIIDYKFGHRFVDEYFNTQGLLYMLGIIGTLSSMPETVSFTIAQPRCFYRGAPVRTHTYKLSEATPYLSAIREAAARATAPNPTATTGPHCEHCPGRHACPTLQRAAYSDAETSTDQQPVDLTPSAAALELRMLDRALLRLTARVEGLRELTTANLRNGAHVPHYKLEPTRSSTKWTVPPAQVIKKLGKKASVPKVITPTQARKLSLDENIISGMVEIIPGGLRLVESSNKDAARVFKP